MLHLSDAFVIGRIRCGDDAKSRCYNRVGINLGQQIEVAQNERGALEDKNGEIPLKANLEHLTGEFEFLFSRLIIAGEDQISFRARNRLAQKLGCILLDVDGVGKILRVIKGREFLLAAVTKLTTMLAAFVGIGGIARPEPVVGAFVFVENDFRFIGDEFGAAGHLFSQYQ